MRIRSLADPRQPDSGVNGWHLPGAAFRVDEDGYFWFEARNDDLLVSSGYNISPFEVETALLEHDAVAECEINPLRVLPDGDVVALDAVLLLRDPRDHGGADDA